MTSDLPHLLQRLRDAGVAVPEGTIDQVRYADKNLTDLSRIQARDNLIAALITLLLDRDAAAKKAEWQRDEVCSDHDVPVACLDRRWAVHKLSEISQDLGEEF
jgi:hypothetical protein